MRQTFTDEQYRAAAKRIHEEAGTLEIDDDAVVSFSDDGGAYVHDDGGAYVQAWVWVYDDDVKPPKENRRSES